jgi:two-component system sensor histidine kinase SenX3
VAVSDQGIGIAPTEQNRIFERFYRVDPARSRATGGTGLGLSIVKHVAANHGGEVTVWSMPGQGSTFTLRLPDSAHASRGRSGGHAPGPTTDPWSFADSERPDLQSPDLQSPDLQSPDLRSPDLRSPDLRSPDQQPPPDRFGSASAMPARPTPSAGAIRYLPAEPRGAAT